MTRFEGLEVRVRVGNTILAEASLASSVRSGAQPETKYIRPVTDGNISVLVSVLDDFKWYNAHGVYIRVDLGGFKCVCRFGEREAPLAKATIRVKEIDSVPSNKEKQMPRPGLAETMGKITVAVQRVTFNQALKEQTKEIRCTKLCAWPAESLTPGRVGNLDKETYVIQPAQIERVEEPDMEDTVAYLTSKRSNDLDFKMTFDFHYRSQVKHPTSEPVRCWLTSTATSQSFCLLHYQPTNSTKEPLLPASLPSQTPQSLGAQIRKILDPRLSKAGPRAWESEQGHRGWSHQVAEQAAGLPAMRDGKKAQKVVIKQEYPFTTWPDAPEQGSKHETHISEKAELESCAPVDKEIYQTLERTASMSEDSNDERDENDGDDEEELRELEKKRRRLEKQLMIQKMELERDDLTDQLAARHRHKARKTSDTRRRGADSTYFAQAGGRIPTPASSIRRSDRSSPRREVETLSKHAGGSRRGPRSSGRVARLPVVDLMDD